AGRRALLPPPAGPGDRGRPLPGRPRLLPRDAPARRPHGGYHQGGVRAIMRCDLSGKVSLVTGAARGIGQAIADRLAANGSRVVYTDVDPAVAEAAARYPGSLALSMDVTRSEEIAAIIDQVIGE